MPPTIEELQRELGVGSSRTVLRYLRALEEAGDIERWPGARGIRLRWMRPGGIETRAVPLVGRVAAGPLTAAVENAEGYVRLPTTFLRRSSGRFFLLRIRGDSMNRAEVGGEVIEDGDLVLVEQQAAADSGQIVVALIDGEATVKHLQRAPGYWMLKPMSSNRAHQPIIVSSDFDVLGTVQKVLKKGSELLSLIEE